MSAPEKKQFYQIEFVKACIPYEQAIRAARILAYRQPDEQLTDEDIQLVKHACHQWLEHRKRWHLISQEADRSVSNTPGSE